MPGWGVACGAGSKRDSWTRSVQLFRPTRFFWTPGMRRRIGTMPWSRPRGGLWFFATAVFGEWAGTDRAKNLAGEVFRPQPATVRAGSPLAGCERVDASGLCISAPASHGVRPGRDWRNHLRSKCCDSRPTGGNRCLVSRKRDAGGPGSRRTRSVDGVVMSELKAKANHAVGSGSCA